MELTSHPERSSASSEVQLRNIAESDSARCTSQPATSISFRAEQPENIHDRSSAREVSKPARLSSRSDEQPSNMHEKFSTPEVSQLERSSVSSEAQERNIESSSVVPDTSRRARSIEVHLARPRKTPPPRTRAASRTTTERTESRCSYQGEDAPSHCQTPSTSPWAGSVLSPRCNDSRPSAYSTA